MSPYDVTMGQGDQLLLCVSHSIQNRTITVSYDYVLSYDYGTLNLELSLKILVLKLENSLF